MSGERVKGALAMKETTKPMVLLLPDEQSRNYTWYDEYDAKKMEDIEVIPFSKVKEYEITFSDGTNAIQPDCLSQTGKAFIKNFSRKNEYMSLSGNTFRNSEDIRRLYYFELIHLLGAKLVKYNKKSDNSDKTVTRVDVGDGIKVDLERLGLLKESRKWDMDYTKGDEAKTVKPYTLSEYRKAKQFMAQNQLNGDADFDFLLKQRDPGCPNKMKSLEYTYHFRRTAKTVLNIAANIDKLAIALDMTSPVGKLLENLPGITIDRAQEIITEEDISLIIKFF